MLLESVIFVFFFAGLSFLLRLRTPDSTWAVMPHLLCNAALLLAVLRYYGKGRPPMYWGHVDLVVVTLFAYLALNVYYSEVRSVAWLLTGLYFDSLAAYFIGRLLFFQRQKAFAICLLLTLGAACASAWFQRAQLLLVQQPDPILLERTTQVLRIGMLVLMFWVISIPLLFMRRPHNLIFLLYAVILLVCYALYVSNRLGWLFTSTLEMRHNQYLTLQTAARIVRNFPLTGCGLGNFPILFDAYRPTPQVPYVAGFSSFIFYLIEIGIVGMVLVAYLLVRFPIYIARRWRLFPNRQLRMSVFIFLLFTILMFIQNLYDADMASPAAWFLLWCHYGILVGLVMVRDPIRIFGAPASQSKKMVLTEAGAPGWCAEPHREEASHDEAKAVESPTAGRGFVHFLLSPAMWMLLVILLLVSVVTVAEVVPYSALKMGRRHPGEALSSQEYGMRLRKAVKLFPLESRLWARLANHYLELAKDPLGVYNYLGEVSGELTRAIALNPYEPSNYEQLAFVYSDTNNQTATLDTLKQGVSNNPNHFVLRMLLVRELEKMGSLAMATYHVRLALFRVAPDQVELYIRLAELYELQGDRDHALLYYKYAKQVVPANAATAARLRRLKERLTTKS